MELKIVADGSKHTQSCVTCEQNRVKRRMKDLNTLTIKKKSSKERVERRKRSQNWSNEYVARLFSHRNAHKLILRKTFSCPWFGNMDTRISHRAQKNISFEYFTLGQQIQSSVKNIQKYLFQIFFYFHTFSS